jgi:hypothetical protein
MVCSCILVLGTHDWDFSFWVVIMGIVYLEFNHGDIAGNYWKMGMHKWRIKVLVLG